MRNQAKILTLIPAKISTNQVLNLVNSGNINSNILIILKSLTDFSDEVISSWLNMNVKTYRSYKSTQSEIKEDIQEHTVMLVALMKHGIEVFGSNDQFSHWLETNNFYLDQKKPIEYLNTISGIKFIDNQLTGMEYGDNA
ncbi:MAG: antitoxin Xre/MbcA/ParS toxin-binding domain-containing protein [Cyclobacteriaceae bacterium]